MTKETHEERKRRELDRELDRELEDTFPASDALQITQRGPDRSVPSEQVSDGHRRLKK